MTTVFNCIRSEMTSKDNMVRGCLCQGCKISFLLNNQVKWVFVRVLRCGTSYEGCMCHRSLQSLNGFKIYKERDWRLVSKLWSAGPPFLSGQK